MKSAPKKTLSSLAKGWIYPLAIALLIASSFKSAIADWNDIPTGSMEPTILPGDRVFVNKLAYDLKVPYTTWTVAKWGEPQRGDIVVFFSPEDDKRLVKRVVGLPGDRLSMVDNQLQINGEPIVYRKPTEIFEFSPWQGPLLPRVLIENLSGYPHPVLLHPDLISRNSFEPIRVPEGNYFLLGDNRDLSADSRFFGFVPRDQIVGQATSIVISREKSFRSPRWDRFFKDLI